MNLALALLAALAAPSLSFAAAAKPADLTRIGAAAAVRGAVKATAPNASVGRVIGSGKPLFLNDHVTTDAAGKLQVLLLDETVFTLGPNADMVLDEFVYDPNTGAGKIAANITKGAFRFVTGKVARGKPENMNVKLKVGTIGVRGTVVAGETGPAGSTVVNAGASPDNEPGEAASNVLVENDGDSVLLNAPGQGVRLLPGQAPGAPADMAAELDRISAALSVEPKKGEQAQGGGDASEESGAATGSGKGNADDGRAAEGGSDDAEALTVIANQLGTLQDGVADWGDLAQLRGTAQYAGSGTYNCTSGTSCPTSGTSNFTLNVNFDAKTVGGGGSNVAFSGGNLNLQNSNINVTSYAGLGGPAKMNLNMANSQFNGTGVEFKNVGGVAAQEATLRIQYVNITSSQNATGTATGSR